MTVIPAVIALILIGARVPDPARPDRPPAPARRLRPAHGHARPDRPEARRRSPRRPPPACTTRSRHLRSRDPALLGAVAFWAFQIAVLWAAFRAFGDAPPLAVLIQAFFVGMLGNLLPIPGGVGGVEGGMIGAFAAFGVDAGLAVVAVLVFRAFTFWLPLVPGVIAFFRLRATSGGVAAANAALLYKVKRERKGTHGRRRERDHHRQRAGRIHGGAVHRPGQPEPARHRGLPVGRPAPADDRRRELPGLPQGDHGPGDDAGVPRPGGALRHALHHRQRDQVRARRRAASRTPSGSTTRPTRRAR